MKKAVAVLIALGALAVSNQAIAQDPGGITLGNTASQNPIFYLNTETRAPVGTFVQLFGGPDEGSLSLVSIGGADTFEIGAGLPASFPDEQKAGFLNAGIASVPGVNANETASFQMRAWRGAADYDSATETGISEVWSQEVGSNPPPPGTPQPAALQAPSFTVVPEPTTYLLGLLGGAALFLFRRRK